jgi:hypothetical protein
MANLRPPSRPLGPTAQSKTAAEGPPTGSPQTMGPPMKLNYHGKPHSATVGQHVRVTIHGKVAAHTMADNVEGGQPGQGAPSSSLELSPHTMTVEQIQGEQGGPQPVDGPADSPAAGAEKVGAAKGSGRPSPAGGGGPTMVDSMNSLKKKYKPLRGTAGPVS